MFVSIVISIVITFFDRNYHGVFTSNTKRESTARVIEIPSNSIAGILLNVKPLLLLFYY